MAAEAAFLKLWGKLFRAFRLVMDMDTFSLILSRLFLRALEARDPVLKALAARALDTRELGAWAREVWLIDRYLDSSFRELVGRFWRQNSRRRLILGVLGSRTAQRSRQAMKSSVSMSGTSSSSSCSV